MRKTLQEFEPRVSRSSRILGWCYGIHGVLIGGFLFFVVLVNSHGARSAAEAGQAIVAALLQPVPMFVAAAAFLLGRRWARPLAMLLPVAIALCYLGRFAGGPNSPHDFLFYFCALQLKNIPGATVLALVAAGFLLRDRLSK